MARLNVAMAAVVLVVAGATIQAQAPEDAAQAAVEAWVKIVDAGNYGASWEEAGTGFKSAVTPAQWTAAVSRARAPFGGVASRTVASKQATDQLPGAPAGKYVVVRFTTTFEKGPGVETVTVMPDGDRGWRVVGYFVMPG